MGSVILHCFNWKFEEIKAKAREIRDLGYSGVLISPPAFSEGNEWFYRYQPIDYRIISSPLGVLDEFISMISVLKENTLKIYVDIVFNHMAYRQNNDLIYPGDYYLEKYNEEKHYTDNCLYGDLAKGLFTEKDFNPKKRIDADDYENPDNMEDVQNGRVSDIRAKEGLPDLDYKSENVIHAQREYLVNLKKLGVNGFRIDAAKHMPVEHIKEVFSKEITEGLYVFGEIIPAHHGKFLEEFLTEINFSAYDFNLFYSVRKALTPDGSLANLVSPNQLDTFKSLTFAITHDIPNNEAMRTFILDFHDSNRTDEKFAYAYLLSRDGGVPLVYTDKGETDGGFSNLWVDMYKDEDIVTSIKFHNLLFGRKMEILVADKCFLIFHREGAGIAAFNKCADSVTTEIDAKNIQGKYLNMKKDDHIDISGDRISFTIPPRSYQLYLKEK